MADSELGELRRPPRSPEARVSRLGGWKSQGLAGGTNDTVVPVESGSQLLTVGGDIGGEVSPDWFAESFTMTSAAAAARRLSRVPVEYSEILRLNGVTLVRDVDYTIDGATVTWTDVTDLLLGIGAGSWTLAATYPYYESVDATPVIAYVDGADSTVLINLPEAVVDGDVGILAMRGDGGGVSGAFASWTKVREGSGDNRLDVWVGTGVGSGTAITVAVQHSAIAVFRGVDGGVAIVDEQSYQAPDSTATTLSAPNATATVGDIVFNAVYGKNTFVYDYEPDGTWTDTGFTGLYVRNNEGSAYDEGVAISAGIATATSVGTAFGMGNDPNTTATGEVINLVFEVV